MRQGLPAAGFVRDLPDAYVPGKTMSVSLDLWSGDFFSFYGFVTEIIPPGWSLEWSSIPPTGFNEETGTIQWRFDIWCTFGIHIRYEVAPPPGGAGEVFFDGACRYCRSGPNQAPCFYVPTTGDMTPPGWIGVTRFVPQEYPSIQAAIDASWFGDTVIVSRKGSPYVENIRMKQGVDLLGSGTPTLHADLSGPDSAVAIFAAPNTCIRGIHIAWGETGICMGSPDVPIHDVLISNCLITGIQGRAVKYGLGIGGRIVNCTFIGNHLAVDGLGSPEFDLLVSNCIFHDNDIDVDYANVAFSCLLYEVPGATAESNIFLDPMFVDPAAGDFRLRRGSPCIDAGDNSVVMPEDTDILGNARIMFGGKSETVDMGAYEYWFISAARQAGTGNVEVSWASQARRTYSVFFSGNLVDWQLAAENVPSGGSITTWLDPPGALTGIPVRFYRVTESE
jgi:hypothetical protein